MLHEISAGIVIYRQLKTHREYLLLHYPGGHFDFPKGHIEKGETEIQAAKRELMEETGIKKVIWIEGFRHKINYIYRPIHPLKPGRDYGVTNTKKHQLSSKDVIFFLARTSEKKITISFEHQGSLWLPYEEAYQQVTFKEAKNTLKKAENFLRKTL